jgi:hypothetical protein
MAAKGVWRNAMAAESSLDLLPPHLCGAASTEGIVCSKVLMTCFRRTEPDASLPATTSSSRKRARRICPRPFRLRSAPLLDYRLEEPIASGRPAVRGRYGQGTGGLPEAAAPTPPGLSPGCGRIARMRRRAFQSFGRSGGGPLLVDRKVHRGREKHSPPPSGVERPSGALRHRQCQTDIARMFRPAEATRRRSRGSGCSGRRDPRRDT